MISYIGIKCILLLLLSVLILTLELLFFKKIRYEMNNINDMKKNIRRREINKVEENVVIKKYRKRFQYHNNSLIMCNKPLKMTYLYMKVDTFKPLPLKVDSYINSECYLDKHGMILTKYNYNNYDNSDNYTLLSEYSKIPILYEKEFKYIWLSFNFTNIIFKEYMKITILDLFREFNGFYLNNNKNNTIIHKKLLLLNLNKNMYKKEYVEYDIHNSNNDTISSFSLLHSFSVNLTTYEQPIKTIHIRLKYSKK